jgi:hypothetical protein
MAVIGRGLSGETGKMASWTSVLGSASIGLSRALLFRRSLAGLVVLLMATLPALAAGKDYSGCINDGNIDPDRRIAACTQIIEDKSEVHDVLVIAYFYRAQAFREKGDDDRVIADMNQVIELDSTYVPAYTNRGTAWQSKGDYERAIADYGQAIALTPADARAYVNRAMVLAKNGEHDRATRRSSSIRRVHRPMEFVASPGTQRASTIGRLPTTAELSASTETMPSPSTTGVLYGLPKTISTVPSPILAGRSGSIRSRSRPMKTGRWHGAERVGKDAPRQTAVM